MGTGGDGLVVKGMDLLQRIWVQFCTPMRGGFKSASDSRRSYLRPPQTPTLTHTQTPALVHTAKTKIKGEAFVRPGTGWAAEPVPVPCHRCRMVTFFNVSVLTVTAAMCRHTSGPGMECFGKCIMTGFSSCQELHRWCHRNLDSICVYGAAWCTQACEVAKFKENHPIRRWDRN